MKNITEFILEKAFDADTTVKIFNSPELQDFLRNEIEGIEDPSLITVTGDGIKYNKILVPGTKLSLQLTAGEYADIFINWLNEFNDKKTKAMAKMKVKKLRKNYGVPRGNYGAKERQIQRERDRNRRIIAGVAEY